METRSPPAWRSIGPESLQADRSQQAGCLEHRDGLEGIVRDAGGGRSRRLAGIARLAIAPALDDLDLRHVLAGLDRFGDVHLIRPSPLPVEVGAIESPRNHGSGFHERQRLATGWLPPACCQTRQIGSGRKFTPTSEASISGWASTTPLGSTTRLRRVTPASAVRIKGFAYFLGHSHHGFVTLRRGQGRQCDCLMIQTIFACRPSRFSAEAPGSLKPDILPDEAADRTVRFHPRPGV